MNLIAVILALASVAAVQSIGDLPQCAQECLAEAITAKSDCTIDDIACVCDAATYQFIVTASTPCIVSRCGTDVAVNQVFPAAVNACNNIPGGDAFESVASSDMVIASGTISSILDSAPSATSAIVLVSPTVARGAITTDIAAVTGVIVTKNSTFAVTSTVVPVTVNGAAIQCPMGMFAALALGTIAYL